MRCDGLRAGVARRAHRPRPPPLGVHAGGPGPLRRRTGGPAARGSRSPSTSTSRRTPACTRGSARSTSCRSSRSTAPPPASGRRRARVRRRGSPTRSRSRCSSTTTPIRAIASLPELRRDAFTSRAPDLGPAEPAPDLGAVAVGARPVLVAVNCELDRDDLALARAIAHAVRERDGGLPGVRALGLRARVGRSITGVDEPGRPRVDRAPSTRATPCARSHAPAVPTSRASSSSG